MSSRFGAFILGMFVAANAVGIAAIYDRHYNQPCVVQERHP